MNFDAVILAGGKSTRMGRDKAWLTVAGEPLLARQIQLACDAGAREVLLSGRAGVDYARFGCRVLTDRWPEAGPLAGIESALHATTLPLLLALAVDMPHMNADLLRQLAAHCAAATGTIPRVNGAIEPLAAFYPTRTLALVTAMLSNAPGGEKSPPASRHATRAPSARAFAERCVAEALARFMDVPPGQAGAFANWNSPDDLPCPT